MLCLLILVPDKVIILKDANLGYFQFVLALKCPVGAYLLRQFQSVLTRYFCVKNNKNYKRLFKEYLIWDNFTYFSIKTYIVGTL